MEQVMLWVTVFGIIVIPTVGWIFNTLITKKIDALSDDLTKTKELFFKKLDENRADVQNNYVLKLIYDQAMAFQNEKTDNKFKAMVEVINTQFKNVEDKIDGIEKLIHEKMK